MMTIFGHVARVASREEEVILCPAGNGRGQGRKRRASRGRAFEASRPRLRNVFCVFSAKIFAKWRLLQN